MTEEQYKYFEQLINEGKVEKIRKHKSDKITEYTFIIKTKEKDVLHKYRAKVANTDLKLLNAIDNLIVQNNVLKKNTKITKLSIAAGVVAGLIIVGSLVGIAHKEKKASFSIMEEVKIRSEQIYNETGHYPTGLEQQKIFESIAQERKESLDKYDDEIEKLKKAKEELQESYYEVPSENAKSM